MLADLRPRGVGEILDAAVALYRARFRSLTALTAAVVVPVQLFGLLVALSTRPDDPDASGLSVFFDTQANEDPWVGLAGQLAVLLVATLSTAFATAAVTRLVAATYLGEGETLGASVRGAGRRIGAVIGLGLVTALGVVAGFFLCFLPGLWLQVMWSVATPALLLEGIGVGGALSRSYALVKPRFWSAGGVYWLGTFLTAVVALSLSVPFVWFLDPLSNGSTSAVVAESIANTVSSIITTPFVATAIVVLYVDLRVRSEGFDVQMLVHRLGAVRA